jgi:hypothetical protein
MFRLIKAAFVACVVLPSLAYASDACLGQIPNSLVHQLEATYPNYRIALSTDKRMGDAEWDKLYYKPGMCRFVASADYDGDGVSDYALFMVDKTSMKPHLIVALQRKPRWLISELPQWNGNIAACYVENIEPGAYKHTQSYDFTPNTSNERENIVATNVSVIAGKEESTGVVYAYQKMKWIYVWVSD